MKHPSFIMMGHFTCGYLTMLYDKNSPIKLGKNSGMVINYDWLRLCLNANTLNNYILTCWCVF